MTHVHLVVVWHHYCVW